MFQLSSIQTSHNILQRLAYTVCALFGASLLLVMAAVLGNALNGGLAGYGVALALISALSVLVLYVLAASTPRAASSVAPRDIRSQPDRDDLAS